MLSSLSGSSVVDNGLDSQSRGCKMNLQISGLLDGTLN